MNTALHIQTNVLPGNKIEIMSPELIEGSNVEVFIIFKNLITEGKQSVMDVIDSVEGKRLFKTSEEIDRYINEERNSWDS
ncbi:MAG TPA: hypothetical protein PL110_15345 [Candidatus Eremiobacteraeota bacterium]|nr:MAG: hypothetical protein BWY64_02857 [bacterium ADurb.Bin363]HPZ09479.1 hypothetical protein [Candidatus Eremiobacteraeota bacterium]